MQERILITGANGQLGSVLTIRLQEKYGINNVIATDIHHASLNQGQFEILDATDFDRIQFLIKKHSINQIYHMAAILSANGEKAPLTTWDLNMKTFLNVLDASRRNNVKKVFFPSSIAVYGKTVSNLETPSIARTVPSTVYGISKRAGENWSNYYFETYGLDVRSIRYPGIIGYQSLPGGGTTDYAVEIFHKAVKEEPFECFLNANTTLPMMYMEDTIEATIKLMETPLHNITVRTSYDVSGMSFSPSQLATAIKNLIPDFQITYKSDFRQKIADTWPDSINDSDARNDWNWNPNYGLKSMTADMIKHLKLKYNN